MTISANTNRTNRVLTRACADKGDVRKMKRFANRINSAIRAKKGADGTRTAAMTRKGTRVMIRVLRASRI